MTPFPLEGGRVGDGGEPHTRPQEEKPRHALGAVVRAGKFRKEMTLGEKTLWKELRKSGVHFRRQAPLGPYIADFCSHGAKLVVEVDGYHHERPERAVRDEARDAWMAGQGYRVLRFPANRVLNHAAEVAAEILDVVCAASPPSPALPPSRGKGE